MTRAKTEIVTNTVTVKMKVGKMRKGNTRMFIKKNTIIVTGTSSAGIKMSRGKERGIQEKDFRDNVKEISWKNKMIRRTIKSSSSNENKNYSSPKGREKSHGSCCSTSKDNVPQTSIKNSIRVINKYKSQHYSGEKKNE